MRCLRCNSELYKGTCIRCGYMENGNTINISENEEEKFYDQKLFNEKFDKLYRNENTLLPFILGPLYFSFRGHLLFGTLLGILDFLFLSCLFNIFLPLVPIINNTITYFLLIILNRTIYATLSNCFCIVIDKLKIFFY